MSSPKAFLCHASEDNDLARRIATSLQSNGIRTFFDEWEIRAGDSICQRIDQGLSDCTHFIVLLTEHSIVKPWVKAEIDGAFMQKMEGLCHLIPLRFNLAHSALPPLLKALHSPEITEAMYEEQLKSLVADIFGISRRPPLGPTPELLAPELVTSVHGDGDPQFTIGALCASLSLTRDDAIDGLDELERLGTLNVHRAMTADENHHVSPLPRLFALFDEYWKEWNPNEDSLRIASRLLANAGVGMPTQDVAKGFSWSVRRLNPALSILLDSNAVRASGAKSFPEIRDWVQATDETRRYVKHRSQTRRGG